MADYKVLKDVVGGELLYGNTVYFTESGESVPYILVHPGNSSNFLFMRKYAPSDKVEFFAESAQVSTRDEERIYEGNTLDRFLKDTFFYRFTPEWRNVFVDNVISVTRLSNGSGVGYSIKRKVFAASATELGIAEQSNGTVPVESPFGAYKYFQLNAQTKRKCNLLEADGDFVEYWTRSKNNHVGVTFNYYALTIDKSGNYDTGTWQKNAFYIRPVISINENVTVVKESTGWRVIPNLPPEKPSGKWEHFSKTNGEDFEVAWNASIDDDGPDAPKYRLQKRVDSGAWEDVIETKGTTYTKVLGYKEALSQIEFRVQAVDTYNNASAWTEIATVSVINNLPPSAPSFISVNGKFRGEQIVITWGESTDDDGNLNGYKIYRSINGSAYSLLSTSSTTVYRDTAGDWETVKYKVVAYDESDVESEGKEASITLSTRITMSIEVTEESDFVDGKLFTFGSGDVESNLTLWFSIEDTVDNDYYVVVAKLDDKITLCEESGVLKGKLFITVDAETWQNILNGEHIIDITVYNSENYSVSKTISFTKDVSGVYLTLKNPVVVNAAEVVSKFLVNVVGSFPEGSSLEVKVTNNANDDSPVWQTVSAGEMNTNEFVEFTNKAAVNGSAFNIIVKASRETAKEPCYISSVNGMFGRNLFEYIFERLDSLEAGAANV